MENITDQWKTLEDGIRIDDSTMLVFTSVIFGVLCQAVNIFGTGTNIINIVCFVKQGFRESINISLLGLAVSDLSSLVTMDLTCILVICAFISHDLPFEALDLAYIVSGTPHFAFTRVSSCITALITLERCLSIAAPLKIRNIATSERVAVLVISIFIFFICSSAPIYFVNKLDLKFSSTRNMTVFGIVFTQDRDTVDMICLSINNFCIPLGTFVIIVISTIILSVQLHRKNKWRKSITLNAQIDTVSVRNEKVAKMVLIISTLFIVCFAPTTTLMLAVAFKPELHLSGKYVNFSLMIGEFSYLMESINSSMNNFVYYHMSSKYRETFKKLFGCFRPRSKKCAS